MQLTLSEVEDFVSDNIWARWNGWNVELYYITHTAQSKPNGAWYNNKWCIRTIVQPNKAGVYDIPNRYFRGARD